MSYAGIDYGRIDKTNRDPVTGIHYGCISQHSVLQAWADSSEPEYGEQTCPKCGNAVVEYDSDEHGDYHCSCGCADYACTDCELVWNSCDCFPEEPLGYSYDAEGYHLVDCLDSGIMVLKSPYYTHAQFCSPCVPGAGNLDSPMLEGVKTYCLGHDWFDGGKAPYPVYRVDNNQEVRS